ncbi:sensor histidine kinase [Actinocorallia populi]|uniref:sensor histidine kinase n=1 Tax=Actinocorallia populi TaxID=2079200 RepID=UPI000D08C6B0|nr:histidine kinase [Actinocorallia populi]
MKRLTAARFGVDAAIALLTFAAVCFAPATVGAPLAWEGPFALGAALGSALMFRRRAPGTVLALSALALFAFRTAGLYEMGWIWPLAPALLTAFSARRHGAVAFTSLGALSYGVFVEVVLSHVGVFEAFSRLGGEALWLSLPLGIAVIRRQRAEGLAERAARLAQEEQTRAAEHRLEIAREVHDVVAHTLAVVGVHLSVAADALADDPDGPGVDLDAARAALLTAREARHAAMTDLKAFVGDLRGTPQAGIPEIESLLDTARTAGLKVETDRAGDLAGVPAAQSIAAYQVVREAVTNTLRHSGASRLSVRLAAGAGDLRVEIRDDGGAPSPVVPGHGLVGMRERVTALGGSVDWESGDGFTVRAVLPRSVGGSAA